MESAVPDFILESVRSLPPLPASTGRLLELARDPDASFKEIARVIELDQTLTARVLRAANSALYGVPRRIQTVQQATVLLGRDTVVNLALSVSILSVQGRFDLRSWPIDPVDFWRHTFAVASLARSMAVQIPGVNPDETYVAGLVHDIGKLLMLEHFGQLYAQVMMAAQDGMKPLFMLEREILETDHAVVGHALCMHWKIPQPITRAVAEHHDEHDSAPRTIADVVRNANDLSKAAQVGNSGSHFAELRSSAGLPARQIGPERLRTMVMELPRHVAEAEHVFGSGQTADPDPPAFQPVCRFIHQHIEDLAERDFVRCVLWSMGFGTEPVDEAFPPDPSRVVGMLSDGPLPGRTVASYREAGIP
ncbi:MAG: HDOD domain-containing protein, partial [Bacteroidota bacterium]